MRNEIPPGVREWMRAAVEDAERRGLPQLKPLLEGLAASTATLRAAEWNEGVERRAFDAPGH